MQARKAGSRLNHMNSSRKDFSNRPGAQQVMPLGSGNMLPHRPSGGKDIRERDIRDRADCSTFVTKTNFCYLFCQIATILSALEDAQFEPASYVSVHSLCRRLVRVHSEPLR